MKLRRTQKKLKQVVQSKWLFITDPMNLCIFAALDEQSFCHVGWVREDATCGYITDDCKTNAISTKHLFSIAIAIETLYETYRTSYALHALIMHQCFYLLSWKLSPSFRHVGWMRKTKVITQKKLCTITLRNKSNNLSHLRGADKCVERKVFLLVDGYWNTMQTTGCVN